MRIVALIPARAGSKRIPGKNTKLLGGKPLIQWTVEAARASGVFDAVFACSDDMDILHAAGCDWVHREPSSDNEPDIAWVRWVLQKTTVMAGADAFAILRPTSPFRTADTIRRAVEQFKAAKCSSIRAVEHPKHHPLKMWQRNPSERTIEPLLTQWQYGNGPKLYPDRTPFHSMPTQSLPEVYVQNSSLEIAHRWCVDIFDSISGPKVAPFFTEGMEGFSIDYPDDWERAERYVAALQAPPAA